MTKNLDDPTRVVVTDGSLEAEADVLRDRLRAAAAASRAGQARHKEEHSMTPPAKSVPETRWELHHDQLEETWTIRRVETQEVGPFATREAARQWMLDTSAERKAALARI
jgi:hypothetical protein